MLPGASLLPGLHHDRNRVGAGPVTSRTGTVKVRAAPVQSPSLTQRRTTLWYVIGVAGVLALADRDRHVLDDRTQPDLALRAVLAAGTEIEICSPATDRLTGSESVPACLRVCAIACSIACLVAAKHMRRAVDHDLRRVDFAVAARLRIGALPVGVAGDRQRVLPAEIIPVVDRRLITTSEGSRASSPASLSAAGHEEQP